MTVFEQKAVKYCPRLEKDLQIKDYQAFGIFGNLGGETGGFKLLQEAKPLVPGSRGGYGWMQWTGPRRRKYEAWCKKNNLDPAADETNYRYLVLETTTDEKASLVHLRETKTRDEAVHSFMSKNLRPGIPHYQGRLNWAKRAEAAVRAARNGQKGAAGAVVVGTVTAVSTPVEYWPYIAAATAIAAVAGYFLFKWVTKKQKHV